MDKTYKFNFDFKEKYLLNKFENLDENFIKMIRNELNWSKQNNSIYNPNDIIQGIFGHGFREPSNIQNYAIPLILWGRDCIIQEKSGRGKTGAFVIGSIFNIIPNKKSTKILILNPTRELAIQTYKIYKEMVRFTKITVSLHIGGTKMSSYDKNHNSQSMFNEDVIIGTPGRIIALLEYKKIKLDDLTMLILDEYDNMLSGKFVSNIETVCQYISMEVQILLISATINSEVKKLWSELINENYLEILLNDESYINNIKQYYVKVDKEVNKIQKLFDIFHSVSFNSCIVYCNKKETAILLHQEVENEKFNAAIVHGDLDNETRNKVYNEFKSGVHRILISTDLLSRGIDIVHLSLIVNFDIPDKSETYTHRIGRTGRFGKIGQIINIVTTQTFKDLMEIVTDFQNNVELLNM